MRLLPVLLALPLARAVQIVAEPADLGGTRRAATQRSPSGLLDRLDESERDTDQDPIADSAPPARKPPLGPAGSEPLRLGPESSRRVEVAGPELKLGLSGARRGRGAGQSAEDMELEDILESEGEQEASRKAAHRMALGFLTALIMVSSVPLLLAYGVKPFAAVLAYLVCMVVVKMCARHTFDSGYPYPFTTTAFQMAVTGLVASCVEQPTVSGARASLNIAVVKCAALALNNMALVMGTPACASLLGALLPVSTYGVERLRGRDPQTPPLGILAACVGAMLLARGEVSCAPAAVALVLGSCLCRSLKTVWGYDFMQRERQSPFRLAAWTAIWCFVIMVPVTLIKEGQQEPIAAFWGVGFWTKIVFLMGGFLSAGLNILMCYVLKFLGPLPQNIYGQLELVLVLTLSVSWYQELMGVVQWIGVGLIGLGCVLIRPGASALKGLGHDPGARANGAQSQFEFAGQRS